MRRSRSRAGWSLLVLAAAGAGCEVSSHGPRDREKVEGARSMMVAAEADSVARDMASAVAAAIASGPQAATTMPELFAPDAVFSDVTERSYAGQAAIRAAYAQGLPAGASIDIRSQSVMGSGDLVVDMGRYTVNVPNPQGGAATSINGRYLVVLQRMDDGSWKIARQLTDAVGIGGALPDGPRVPGDTSRAGDSAATTPPAAESGFTAAP